jgi:hypothetical protein
MHNNAALDSAKGGAGAMKASAVAILILLSTGEALAVANKAWKTGDYRWCVRSLHSQHGKALTRTGRTRASAPQRTAAGTAAAFDMLGAAKL